MLLPQLWTNTGTTKVTQNKSNLLFFTLKSYLKNYNLKIVVQQQVLVDQHIIYIGKQLPQFQMIMFSSSGLTVFLYRLPGPEDEGCRQTAAGQTSTTIWIYGPGTKLHNSQLDTCSAWFCLQHNRLRAILCQAGRHLNRKYGCYRQGTFLLIIKWI